MSQPCASQSALSIASFGRLPLCCGSWASASKRLIHAPILLRADSGFTGGIQEQVCHLIHSSGQGSAV